MVHGWKEEHEQSFAAAAAFGRERVNPSLEARARSGAWDKELWRAAAGMGLLGLALPTEYGGLGGEVLAASRALAGLGFGCRDNGWMLALGAHLWCVCAPLARLGSPGQRRRFLPDLIAGRGVGAIAITEPDHGSDATRFSTRARLTRAGWEIGGVKSFITNAPVATMFVVFADTGAESGEGGGGEGGAAESGGARPPDLFAASAFLVARDSPGLRVGPPLAKAGLETSPTAEVVFDRVVAPREALLGEAGSGQTLLRAAMEWERGCLLAPAVGTMERLTAATVAYTRERRQFGRPILDFEAVAGQLAGMQMDGHAARLMQEHFAARKDAGLPAFAEAAMAKLQISEAWLRCAATALRLHGAAGYCRELEFEGQWRDAMASTIFSGASEMQRNLIAEGLLAAERPRRATLGAAPAQAA